MTNIEKQSDEIFALQSIFDKKFRLLDDNQYEISIEFELMTPLTIRFNTQTSIIQNLPPFTLIIHYHDEYPSDYPPSFILSCFYFSKFHLKKLCQKIDNYPFTKGEVCVYEWIDLIKLEINDEINFHTEFDEQENDPRALNGYSIDNGEKVFRYLINYNQERENEQFQNQFQTCSICADDIRGLDCIRLHRCGHFYCRFCLNNYIRMTLDNGKFGEKLHCPQNQCKQPLLPTEIKQAVQDEELYERYERLTLQRSLELMNDIVWCPRCQLAVLSGDGDDNLAMCDQCRYTFCKKCKEIFHSQTMCPKDYIIQQLKLQQEKERERIRQQKEEALARLAEAEEKKKSLAAQKMAAQKYRQIVIKLSDEEALLEQILNAERIESMDTQYCPKCHIRIEKNGGCSHMHCSQCDHHFTWKIIEKPEPSNNILLLNDSKNNSMPVEFAKKELDKVANTVGPPKQETIQDDDTDSVHEEEEDRKISIDNQSTIGSAIVNRVRQCPFKSCKKFNVKTGQDNWIVCNGCMKQYCFLCGRIIFGTRHFEKKCQRHTPI